MAVYPIKMMKDESGQPFVPLTSLDAVIGEKNLQYILDAVQVTPGHFKITDNDLRVKDITNSVIVVRWPQITSTVKPSYLQLNNNNEALLYNGTGTEYLDLEGASGTVNLMAFDGTKWIQASGSGSGGGHVIIDGEGHTMEQQKALSFVGFNVENDNANRATKIVNPTPINNLTTNESGQGSLDAYQGHILAGRSIPTGGTTGQVLAKKNGSDYQVEWVDRDGDDVVVSNGSIAQIVSLTYAEYKELEDKNQIDTTTQYYITDAGGSGTGVVQASDVKLDNGDTLDNKLDNMDIINDGQNTRLDVAEGNIDTMVKTINNISQTKGRINDSISITFSDSGDRTITLPSTAWAHTPLPLDKVLANTNSSLYSLNSSTGCVTIKEDGYYMFSGTANTDTTINWSLVLSCMDSIINDVTAPSGMVNCWLSPVVLYVSANTEAGLKIRGAQASASLKFRPNRSYFTIVRVG